MTPQQEINCLIAYSKNLTSDWQIKAIHNQIRSLEQVTHNLSKLVNKDFTNKVIKCIGPDCTIYDSITDCSNRTRIPVYKLRDDFDRGSVKYGIKKII